MTVLIAVLLAFPGIALAFNFEGLPFTNNSAERFDLGGYYKTYSLGSVIGGPTANNSLGYASRFELAETTTLSQVLFDMSLSSYGEHSANVGVDFYFKIYGGDTFYHDSQDLIPNLNNLLFQSQPGSLRFDIDLIKDGGLIYYKQGQSLFSLKSDVNITLEPGVYWLAFERNYGDSMDSGGFLSVKVETVIAPPKKGGKKNIDLQ